MPTPRYLRTYKVSTSVAGTVTLVLETVPDEAMPSSLPASNKFDLSQLVATFPGADASEVFRVGRLYAVTFEEVS